MMPPIQGLEITRVARTAAARGWVIADVSRDNGELIIHSPANDYAYELKIILGMLGTWVLCGEPRVRVEPTRLEPLLAVPDRGLRVPWPVWLVELPNTPAITFIDTEGKPDPVRMILCVTTVRFVSYLAIGALTEYIEIGADFTSLRDGTPTPGTFPLGIQLTMQPEDRIATGLVGRLICNTALGLFEIDGVDRRGPERAAEFTGHLPAGDYYLY